MNYKENGGPAFSAPADADSWGMTLRDYFASKALSGICSHHDTWGIASHMEMAVEAYKMADAMLETRAALAMAGENP